MHSEVPQHEQWQLVQTTPSSTRPRFFQDVMQNLLRNPNITSSLLFRAEIFYDSSSDASASWSVVEGADDLRGVFVSDFIRHMKADLRPRGFGDSTASDLGLGDIQTLLDNESKEPHHLSKSRRRNWRWEWQQTVVRNLVPRNPQRDKPCVQSCWYFKSFAANDHVAGPQAMEADHAVDGVSSEDDRHENASEEQRDLVIYIPHVDKIDDIPFYHPACRGMATLHTWSSTFSAIGSLTQPTDVGAEPSDEKAIEGSGTLSIYYSLFPGSDMTTRLSRTANAIATTVAKHCAGRAAGYVKRVLHDRLAPQKDVQDTYTRLKATYARPLIDGWVESTDPGKHVFEDLGIAAFLIELWKNMYGKKNLPWPGFVDIGCGNGVLVYVLLSEGYTGWGFDIRKRKTWDALPQEVIAGKLLERICVPSVLQQAMKDECGDRNSEGKFHDGLFPEDTFIISNHADELTAWTPLLAYMSNCYFIAIPCCSHDFGGNRFRAKARHLKLEDASLQQPANNAENKREEGIPESGQLVKRNQKEPSAYASLCAWLERLTDAAGFVAEKEILRIPSTRNTAILGRSKKTHWDVNEDVESKTKRIAGIIENEVSKGVQVIAREWIERSRKIASSKGCGH